MCDTILAPPSAAAGRMMLFGKNSDRQRNEAQLVERLPRGMHAPGTELKCTYIKLPQVAETHAVLLCRPFWLWGAEMGANEHGVVIGNEGLRARVPAPEAPALTGMDLVRLGLERAATAAEAVSVIASLLERHGQGGDCGHLIPNHYHNGFLICDADEAFVVETVASEWLVERLDAPRSLSNIYSVATAETVSPGLDTLVGAFADVTTPDADYATAITHPDVQHLGQAGRRRARTGALLNRRAGALDEADMMRILRDHGDGGGGIPLSGERTVCMHAAEGDNYGQTTGSMVSRITRRESVHWVTASAAPCLSIFKPVLFDTPPPSLGTAPTGRFDARAFWWRHELLHRHAALGDMNALLDEISPERDALEAASRKAVDEVLEGGDAADRAAVVARCWRQAQAAEERWKAQVRDSAETPLSAAFRESWREMNRIAGFPAER